MARFIYYLSQILALVLLQTDSYIILHNNPANNSVALELINYLKVTMPNNCFFNLDNDEELNNSFKGLRELTQIIVLDLSDQVYIDYKIAKLAGKLRQPKMSVFKVQTNVTCDLLDVTKILEENASEKLKYLSEIHLCLEQGWNINKSEEKIYFNLVWGKIYKLHLNKVVKNDCGEYIGFNSSVRYDELDNLLQSMKSTTTDDFCAAKCPFESQNTTSDAVRKLCPTCLECISRPGETDTHRGCSTNRVCAGYGCFKQVQMAENGTYNETMMSNIIKSSSPSYLDNLELLTTLLGAVTFFVLIFYLRPSSELSHANIWITFILLVLILMMRWDIVRTTLLPKYCWLACPAEMILYFIMCFISIQQYWKDNLPALNLNNVLCTCLGVILNGIIVTFIHQTDLTQSCNNLKSLNASSKDLQCGELERIKQDYFYSIIALIVILAFYKMITMKEKMTLEMAVWFILMMIMIIINLFRTLAMFSGFVTIWWKIYEAVKKKDSKSMVQTLNTQMNSNQTIEIETKL